MPHKPPAGTTTGRIKPRVNMTLDRETIGILEQIVDEDPDIESVSAAVRHLARTWKTTRMKGKR